MGCLVVRKKYPSILASFAQKSIRDNILDATGPHDSWRFVTFHPLHMQIGVLQRRIRDYSRSVHEPCGLARTSVARSRDD